MIDNYATRVEKVLNRIKNIAESADRKSDQVTLVAVSKTQSVSAIRSMYDCGIRHFGENRAEELQMKVDVLKDLPGVKWNFIGSLQSRQADVVASSAHVFHAVDRIKIAKVLSDKLKDTGKTLEVYIQVNVSGEESKHGFDCSAWESNEGQRATLLESIEQISTFPHLVIKGLMTMAPMAASASEVGVIFGRTKSLFDWVNKNLPGTKLTDISMGMSGDFESAIKHGATVIRVGSAIFK